MILMSRKIKRFYAFRAEVLKQLALRDWSYSTLAVATGYSLDYVYHIMSGQYGSKRAAIKIAKILNIPRELFL